jgi:hypothetical protein
MAAEREVWQEKTRIRIFVFAGQRRGLGQGRRGCIVGVLSGGMGREIVLALLLPSKRRN